DPYCCTPSWQLPFHDAFCPDRRLLIRESSNNFLLFAENIGSPENVVLTPIEQNWLFGCPLLGKHAVDLLADTVDDIKNYYPTFPRIVISGIRPGGVLAKRLLKTFSSNFHLFLLLDSSSTQCNASLTGGFDGFLSRRSSRQRRKLKRLHQERLDKGIWFEQVAPTSREESEQTFVRMLSIEHTSWKGLQQCGMEQEPATSFYKSMITRLASSKSARIIFAKHEENDIGYIFGGLAGNLYRGQQFSYSEAWKNASIGNLLQIEQIKWLSEEKCKRYDMGPVSGEKMEYKRHWTERQGRLESWMLIKK
ncbi:MAG TPA: GNAT family N-acetyltransferase, partial [Gammaproteobacteria bacterium]|nr:GNAT family N-acetyltransferase [Gammaproteobacteria bacterium]